MKVKKMLLREETEKVLHTKSNGDKLVAAASGDGYTAFTKDDVHIGHISAETDAAAIAEFSKKEPKYEALDMSQDELRITAERYLDFEIGELMAELLEKTSTMSREQLSRLVRLCRNFYALLEEFAANELDEGYMEHHEGQTHVDTLDLMAALKSVVREYGHMELATPVYCELKDDEHGRRLALNSAMDEGLFPDQLMPGRIGGDININLDGSNSSVGVCGGTATTTNNGNEGDHNMSNNKDTDKEDLDEAMSKSGLASIFGTLGETYGKIMLNSEQADKILAACGQEPQGKAATFDEVLSVVQDVIAGAPLAVSAIVALLEAVFDVLLALATAGLIALPLDGPVGECITAILAAIPVTVIVGAIAAAPAALANRLVLLARKALRNKNDAEKVEKAAQQVAVKEEPVDDTIDESLMGLAALAPVAAAPMAASAMTPKNSRGNFAGNTINFNFSGNNARIDPYTDLNLSGNSNDMSGNSASVDAKVAEVSPEIGANVAAEVSPEVAAQVNPNVSANVKADGASVGAAGGVAGSTNVSTSDEMNESIKDTVSKFVQRISHHKFKNLKTQCEHEGICVSCGGELQPEDTNGVRKCTYCGNLYFGKQLLICTQCGSTEIDPGRGCKCRSCGYEFENDHGKCVTCGGELVKNDETTAKCKYCGNIHDIKTGKLLKKNEALDDDFMDAENMDMSEFDSPTGKLEDIEFVMTEYIADSMLIEFVKKVDATTWLVGVEDEVVTVKFDPSWSEYVYTIEGKGPYSHRSYEFISRDVYDFVMSQRNGNEYDDDFDDLSSFRECSEVKKADALYGVKERDELVEAVYTDTNGIMGVAGETYTTAELRQIWNDNHNDDPSMAKYNGDYDKWVSDTLAQMSRNDDVDEAFDMTYGPDLDKLSWQVASYLDVDALGEDNWIEFDCEEPRGLMGSKEKTMRFQAIGENAHKYGYLKTAGAKVEVHFRNGSEAVCNSAEEIARFIAGEFGISL